MIGSIVVFIFVFAAIMILVGVLTGEKGDDEK